MGFEHRPGMANTPNTRQTLGLLPSLYIYIYSFKQYVHKQVCVYKLHVSHILPDY